MPASAVAGGDGVADRRPGLLAESAAEHERRRRRVSARPATIASMWSVRCVSTRQVRPLSTARCGRRRRSARYVGRRRRARLNTAWMWAASSSLTSVVVWWTTSSRRTSSAPAIAPGLISWRVGPQWNPMIASSLSRRYGVAVRPSHRRRPGPLDARRERDGGEVVALVDDDEAVPSNIGGSSRRARLWIIATSTTPVGLFLPPPIWPIWLRFETEMLGEAVRHWSTSSLRSTRTSVGTSVMGDHRAGHHRLAGSGRGDEDASVVAGEIVDRGRLLGSKLADERELDRLGVGAIVDEIEPAAETDDEIGDLLGESAGKVEPFEVLAVAADEPWCVPRREPHPLLLVELGVGDRREVLQRREHRWRQPGPFDRQHRPESGPDHRRRSWPAATGQIREAQAGPASTGRSDSARAATASGARRATEDRNAH